MTQNFLLCKYLFLPCTYLPVCMMCTGHRTPTSQATANGHRRFTCRARQANAKIINKMERPMMSKNHFSATKSPALPYDIYVQTILCTSLLCWESIQFLFEITNLEINDKKTESKVPTIKQIKESDRTTTMRARDALSFSRVYVGK